MTLGAVQEELTAWGASFPEFIADYPPANTPVWVATILGRGVAPAPPGKSTGEECLEIRAIVLPGQGRALAIFGRPSEGC